MKNPDIEFALPGSWKFVAIADEAAAKRTIATIAEQTVGRADERAKLRAEVRAQFTNAADRARKAGGEAMWICDEVAPGIPLPASITLYRPALGIRSTESGDDRIAALHELLGPATDGVTEADLVAAGQPAVRWAEITSGPASDEPDAPNIETVQSTYWVLQPDSQQVLLLVFACGMPTLKDQLVELFDLIVTTMKSSATAAGPTPQTTATQSTAQTAAPTPAGAQA